MPVFTELFKRHFRWMRNLFISVLLFILSLEIFALIQFYLMNDKILTGNPEFYVLDQSTIEKFGHFYDRDLGWDTKFNTTYGERPSQVDYKDQYIATFGDSFTYGDGVPDHCTWQEFLENKFSKNVFNFGVGAYGLDQSFLKMQKILPNIKNSQFIVIAFIPGDLNRSVNIYRNFLRTFEGGVTLTKPRFRMSENKTLRLIQNPIQTKEDLSKLTSEVFIKELWHLDWWHQKFEFPQWKFPYSLFFLDKFFWKQVRDGLDYAPWFDEEGVAIFKMILKDFSTLTKKLGAVPIVLFLPDYYFLEGLELQDHKMLEMNKVWSRECALANVRCLSPLEEIKKRWSSEELFTARNGAAHYSCAGNQLVADYLLHAMVSNSEK
jgi:hypothetical protein